MKKYIPYLVIFLIGALAGMWAHRQYNSTHTELVVQTDTLVRFDTIKYSKLELIGKNYRLDLPKIDNPRMVLIPYDSTTIIYRDSIRYVTLPRQYFYTSVDDMEIWHSGIDSTIDSLNVVRKTQEITKTTQPVTKRNSLSIGIETSYMNALSTPIYLEYERMLHKNLGFYVQLAYDLPTKRYGAGIGLKGQIEW